MGLVTCPDCSKEISDIAVSCPSCGRPMHPVQIEKTAKKHKGNQAKGLILLPIGFIVLISGVVNNRLAIVFIGLVIVLIGGTTWFKGKTQAWWNHG